MSVVAATLRTGIARTRQHRVLGPLSVVILAALVATGLRTGAGIYQNYQLQQMESLAKQTAKAGMPTSAQIEQVWGIRVITVQLLADHGLVEVRYLVLDETKAAKLHADTTSLKNIPWMKIEGSGLSIKSQSVMYHFQHGVGNGVEGHTYSIIYGNAGNAIHPYSLVTVVMPDDLQLQHVPVGG
jgi:hypothetical protein